MREGERDPRERAIADDDDDDRERRETERDPLRHAQALAQHEHAEQHSDDRVDEVAEARLDHMAGEGGEDVDLPVDVDQHAGEGRQAEQPAAAA